MNRHLKLTLSIALLTAGLASAAFGADHVIRRLPAPQGSRGIDQGVTAQAEQGIPDWVYSPEGEVALLAGLAPAGYGYGRRNVMSIALGGTEGVGSIVNRRGFTLCTMALTYTHEGDCLIIVGCEPLGTLLSGCGEVQ